MKLICMLLVALLSMCQSQAKDTGNHKEKENMKTLVVYYSFTAGNTRGIAERVQKATGAAIVALETVKPYPTDYQTVVRQGHEEVERGYKPELKPLGVNVADYDRIVIGTPTWWYKMAPAVLTFLSENDFTGKTVVPFMTNAGWPGSVIKDMTDIAEKRGAKVEKAHEFLFSSDEAHRDQMVTPEKELNAWLESLK